MNGEGGPTVKPVGFASIVVRGIALWLVVNAIANLSLFLMRLRVDQLPRDAQLVWLLSMAVMIILPLVTAVVVWASADWLAARVASLETESAPGPEWTSPELLRLAVATVGLVTLVQTLPDLVWDAASYVSLNWSRRTLLGPMDTTPEMRAQFWNVTVKATLAKNLAKVALGAVLVLRPSLIASLVGRGERRSGHTTSAGVDDDVQQRDAADEGR
jgi:hypothetical protein